MENSTAFGVPSPAEKDTLAGILALAFAFPVEDSRAWLDRVLIENVRVHREDERVAGGLIAYPLGQWFGGRSVPMAGIGGVGVEPAAQGKGVATRMMRTAMRELAAEGYALSCLYPATQPLYRRAGYERAGSNFEIRVPANLLALGDRSLPLRPATPKDLEAIRALHREHGRARPGSVDRSPQLWQRILDPWRTPKPTGFVVERDGAIDGYCFFARTHKPEGRQALKVNDMVAASPQAATRLLTFLGDHQSLVDDVSWSGGDADPLLALLREPRHSVEIRDVWMLRILNVAKALSARGYPRGFSASLDLEIFDEVIPTNRGRFVLDVAGGEARVRSGGDGSLKMHVRGLAPLYTGYLPASNLALIGLLEGDEAAQELATALFAGPAPAMSDFF
ncbi:GNAT family N-acetyltransferase [Vulgatibacter incomptus]|uniref:Acetyltransferase n=1 Tax=Vulgatibacter incomptus TaxID=1391653 RepID=A0A0K1PBP9_9BACT|nr:GNAT family N-acetyltransferase [Vulgatibacter incomptus]AKU90963.1 Acetyltransferase [Vulgatibacter incomptus]